MKTKKKRRAPVRIIRFKYFIIGTRRPATFLRELERLVHKHEADPLDADYQYEYE